MKQVVAKRYDFSNVKFMSTAQLSQHYSIYTKYIDSFNKAQEDMLSNIITNNCSSNYSDIRSAQKATTFCLDSIKLHEMFFENLTGNNNKIHGNIEEIIDEKFGSYKNFTEKFKCIAQSMRGWVTFCYDTTSDDYFIYGQDSHDDGVILCAKPLIVLDVYEHSYMIDYGINRALYVDVFLENLDFSVVNNRINHI
jgi:Fe-Mn family superoxide dismutase